MICEDPRQAVPPTGQTWTSLTQLSSSRRNTILEDTDDHRVKFIGTEAGFAINQTRECAMIATGDAGGDAAIR